MTVKELKAILETFNEDLEVRIGGVFDFSSFRIDSVGLGKERMWEHRLLSSGKTDRIAYDKDIVRIESSYVHTLEEDAMGEDI